MLKSESNGTFNKIKIFTCLLKKLLTGLAGIFVLGEKSTNPVILNRMEAKPTTKK